MGAPISRFLRVRAKDTSKNSQWNGPFLFKSSPGFQSFPVQTKFIPFHSMMSVSNWRVRKRKAYQKAWKIPHFPFLGSIGENDAFHINIIAGWLLIAREPRKGNKRILTIWDLWSGIRVFGHSGREIDFLPALLFCKHFRNFFPLLAILPMESEDFLQAWINGGSEHVLVIVIGFWLGSSRVWNLLLSK